MKIFDIKHSETIAKNLFDFFDNEKSMILLDKIAVALKNNDMPNTIPSGADGSINHKIQAIEGNDKDQSGREACAYDYFTKTAKKYPLTKDFYIAAQQAVAQYANNGYFQDEAEAAEMLNRVSYPAVPAEAKSSEAVIEAHRTALEQLLFMNQMILIHSEAMQASNDSLAALLTVNDYIRQQIELLGPEKKLEINKDFLVLKQ